MIYWHLPQQRPSWCDHLAWTWSSLYREPPTQFHIVQNLVLHQELQNYNIIWSGSCFSHICLFSVSNFKAACVDPFVSFKRVSFLHIWRICCCFFLFLLLFNFKLFKATSSWVLSFQLIYSLTDVWHHILSFYLPTNKTNKSKHFASISPKLRVVWKGIQNRVSFSKTSTSFVEWLLNFFSGQNVEILDSTNRTDKKRPYKWRHKRDI